MHPFSYHVNIVSCETRQQCVHTNACKVVLGPLSEYHFSNHTYTSKHRNKQNLLNTLRPNVVENKHSRE